MASNPTARYPGTFASLQSESDRTRCRLAIPKVVKDAIDWKADEVVNGVVAEVITQGHLRIHLRKIVQSQRDAIEERLMAERESSRREFNLLLANQSRCVDLRYDHSVHRFRLSNDALIVLGAGKAEILTCYVQAVNRAVDVLSPEAFFERQNANGEAIGLDP